jgi:hypothetical protein
MDTLITLQQFMTFTKAMIYGLIVLTLVGMAAFWYFLTERDDE